jgi:hypothetical protein
MIYSYGIAPVGYHKDSFVIGALAPTTDSYLPFYQAFRFLSRFLFLLGIADFTAREIHYALRSARSPYLFLSLPYFLLKIPRPSKVPFLRALDEGTKVDGSVSSEFLQNLRILQILLFF